MPNCKADAAPTGIGAPKVGRGGGSRGAGRKLSTVNAKGFDGPAAPRCTQATLGDLLGERLKKKSTGGGCTGWCWCWCRCHQVGLRAARRRRRGQPRGRYESAMWRAAGLAEPKAAPEQREAAGEAGFKAGAQVDNLEAGGFFARFGRERDEPRATVIPPAATPVPPPPVPPVPAVGVTRTRINQSESWLKQSKSSNTIFKYQYQYHSKKIKKRSNTGIIPVNPTHCSRRV